jgi:glutaredoxin
MADFMTSSSENHQLQVARKCVEPAASNHRPHHTKIEKFWLAGSALLYGGVGLLILSGIDQVSYLPFPMPEFWYSNRGFWPFVGILAIPCGMILLKKEPKLSWQPTLAGPRFGSVVLYTRNRCHLCDDAKILLKTYARWLPTPVEVDIDGDEELKEQFNTCVPVVEIDGKVRFRGIVDEMLLRRLIEASEPTA